MYCVPTEMEKVLNQMSFKRENPKYSHLTGYYSYNNENVKMAKLYVTPNEPDGFKFIPYPSFTDFINSKAVDEQERIRYDLSVAKRQIANVVQNPNLKIYNVFYEYRGSSASMWSFEQCGTGQNKLPKFTYKFYASIRYVSENSNFVLSHIGVKDTVLEPTVTITENDFDAYMFDTLKADIELQAQIPGISKDRLCFVRVSPRIVNFDKDGQDGH